MFQISLKIELFKTHTLWGTVKREDQRMTLIQVTIKISIVVQTTLTFPIAQILYFHGQLVTAVSAVIAKRSNYSCRDSLKTLQKFTSENCLIALILFTTDIGRLNKRFK